jgi:predicted dienelactone hydrolase
VSPACKLISIMACSALVLSAWCAPADARTPLRDRIRDRIQQRKEQRTEQPGSSVARHSKRGPSKQLTIAGLQVAVWEPRQFSHPAPLVVFSHGFHGINRQSEFIMEALAQAGFLVMAPNHDDALGKGGFSRPEVGFAKSKNWTESTYRKRGEDITRLITALRADPAWKDNIDWSKLALMGHSLGGYTSLGLAGGWPSWKLPDIKAVVALSPFASPFSNRGTLEHIGVPVMYQTGTADLGVAPFLKGKNGVFSQTSSPAVFVEFKGANHFTWTNFNKQKSRADLINYYCVAFLNRFVNGDLSANPAAKLQGVTQVIAK